MPRSTARALAAVAALALARCDCGDAQLASSGAQLGASAGDVDFGTQHVGSHTQRIARVEVHGRGTMTFSAAHLVQRNPAFQADFSAKTVDAPGTLDIAITYSPAGPEDDTDTLSITTDLDGAALVDVHLHGRAVTDCTDHDGDGAGDGADCRLGPDCNDANPAVHPGATEVCGNGLDDDCNPATTDTCPPCAVDKDGDGYGEGCVLGPDCDDERAAVHPGATEICGNGLDDDCNQATSDDCPTDPCAQGGCGAGCADGAREGFVDAAKYPAIAGCAGGWTVPGVAQESAPTCALGAGDDGANPGGDGCSASDLCAPGWHVCRTAREVATHSPDGCAGGDVDGLFFATRQSGNGCGECSVSANPADACSGDTCLTSCYPTSVQTNDVFGCGGTGALPAGSCAPLDRFSHNACGQLPAPWNCASSDGTNEALVVVKPGPGAGGVVCCAD
jgi:hypothetical protein